MLFSRAPVLWWLDAIFARRDGGMEFLVYAMKLSSAPKWRGSCHPRRSGGDGCRRFRELESVCSSLTNSRAFEYAVAARTAGRAVARGPRPPPCPGRAPSATSSLLRAQAPIFLERSLPARETSGPTARTTKTGCGLKLARATCTLAPEAFAFRPASVSSVSDRQSTRTVHPTEKFDHILYYQR